MCVVVRADDVRRGAVPGSGVAHGEGHLGTGAGQGAGGLDADAGGCAGDDRPPAGEVDALDDLRRGARRIEGEWISVIAGASSFRV